MTTPKAAGVWSRAWAPVTSFLLHGAVLAAVLWALQAPSQPPASTALPMIAMEFVAPPAPAAAPSPTVPETQASEVEPPAVPDESPMEVAAESPVETIESPTPPITEDRPPLVESTVAEIALPLPPPPKPKVEAKPAPKPQTKPVSAPGKPQPSKAKPTQTATAEDAAPALPSAVPGPSPAAPQQAAVPVVAPPAEIAPPADYVGLLLQQLNSKKVYPRTAQQRRQQGRAMLRIAIDRGGHVLSFKIEKGTGYDLLDQEVAAMVKRASPLPPIPATVAGAQLEVVVPIEFLLR